MALSDDKKRELDDKCDLEKLFLKVYDWSVW